jgi:hypothetical protein
VLILGINHQIQWVRNWSAGSSRSGEIERFEQSQKDQFRELLHKRIAERAAQFIAEETKHGEPSIAHDVCLDKGCHYANIEMHPDERAEQNIPANYERDPTVTPEQKTRFHQQREEYMFGKSIVEGAGAKNVIVICGRYHRPALAKKFREAGHQVDEADIQDEPWYIEDWMSYMMRL